jgi:DNA-binding NarL/FixJ family response regulator
MFIGRVRSFRADPEFFKIEPFTTPVMKFLIVDDSSAMRRCIKELLSAEAQIFECSDGQDAVKAFTTHQPDWVLMDINMKLVDGLTAAGQIIARWPAAKIIFVTSHDLPRFRQAALQLKVEGYVLKDNLDQINQIVSGKADLSLNRRK